MTSMRTDPTPQERAKYVVLAEPERYEELITEQILEAVRCVLDRLGTSQICVTCGKPIYWMVGINGSRRDDPIPPAACPTRRTARDDRPAPGRLGRWQQQNVRS